MTMLQNKVMRSKNNYLSLINDWLKIFKLAYFVCNHLNTYTHFTFEFCFLMISFEHIIMNSLKINNIYIFKLVWI